MISVSVSRCRTLRRASKPLFLWSLSIALVGAHFALPAEDTAARQRAEMAALEENVKTEHYAEAATALTRILETAPHSSAEVYRLLAFSQYKLGNSGEAQRTCEQGIALYPGSRDLAQLYVSILHEVVPADERSARLAELLKEIPNSPILLKAMGEELMTKDPESTQALSLLSSAAKLLPQDAEAHFFYGEAACFNKQDALCIRELTRAHQLSPQNQYANMQIYTMIAVAADRLKQPARAAQAFELSMKANEQLSSSSPYAALKYVNFLTTQGKDKEAMRIIDEILTWDRAYGPAHFERAKMLAQRGATEEAAKEAELALQDSRVTEADLRAYHAFLAKTYFALGRESDAQVHQNWIESHQTASPQP
jgi:predicted Zn-dependent protease